MSIQMLVLLAPVIFGLMGFAVDLGRLYLIRGELTQTAESMATAAAARLIGTETATADGTILEAMNAVARRLDPAAHAFPASNTAAIEAWGRGEDERAVALDPTSEDTYRVLGLVFVQQAAYGEAERAFREAITLSPELSYATAGLAHVLALAGRRGEAEALVAQLEARARNNYVSPVAFCIAHLGLRNIDQVFYWFERAYQDRRGWMTYLKVDPIFDPVKDDPRFAEFVKRMGL